MLAVVLMYCESCLQATSEVGSVEADMKLSLSAQYARDLLRLQLYVIPVRPPIFEWYPNVLVGGPGSTPHKQAKKRVEETEESLGLQVSILLVQISVTINLYWCPCICFMLFASA